MNRILFYTILFFIISSCSNKENEIDNIVNQSIIEQFSEYDPNLWDTFETEFFNRLSESGFLKNEVDTISALQKLNLKIMTEGYWPEFYSDTNDIRIKKLITDLETIGYNRNDESAHKFLYNLLDPLVSSFEKENRITLDSLNMIKAYVIFNPDSIQISYDLSLNYSEKNEMLENRWNKKGTRKMLILFYMSRMINQEWMKKH